MAEFGIDVRVPLVIDITIPIAILATVDVCEAVVGFDPVHASLLVADLTFGPQANRRAVLDRGQRGVSIHLGPIVPSPGLGR